MISAYLSLLIMILYLRLEDIYALAQQRILILRNL